jgi:hypothetical protein
MKPAEVSTEGLTESFTVTTQSDMPLWSIRCKPNSSQLMWNIRYNAAVHFQIPRSYVIENLYAENCARTCKVRPRRRETP